MYAKHILYLYHMIIIDAVYLTLNLYSYLGMAHKVYTVYNYGKDGYNVLVKAASYFGGSNKREPDLNDSFLIEKEEVENNWELLKFYKFN